MAELEPQPILSIADDAVADRLTECVERGGVAVFPTDTVYGLACDPENGAAATKLYELKGRARHQAAAVMFFSLGPVFKKIDWLGPQTSETLKKLLPGPITAVIPNADKLYPLTCGASSDTLGLRVPRLDGELEVLTKIDCAVLQSSANLSGGVDARALAQIPKQLIEAVDLVIDGGELPGVASTVLDLTGYEENRSFSVLREGALATAEIERALAN